MTAPFAAYHALVELLRADAVPPSRTLHDAILDAAQERFKLEELHAASHEDSINPLLSDDDADDAAGFAAYLDRRLTRIERAEELARKLLSLAEAAERTAPPAPPQELNHDAH